MLRYQVCGVVLASNVPLPELRTPAQISFQLLAPYARPQPIQNWLDHRRDEQEEIWLSIGKSDAEYVLRFPQAADFYVSSDGQKIICHPAPEMPAETIRHLLLDQVIPMVLSHTGKVVMHAGAIATPQDAVAFIGASGAGKSTLTSYFAQQGFPVLTDDCLLLEQHDQQIFGVASYPGVRLFPAHLQKLFAATPAPTIVSHNSEKQRLALGDGFLSFQATPVPLRKILLLEESSTLEIIPVAPGQGFIELVKNSFHLDIKNRTGWEIRTEILKHIINKNLLFRLRYPRDINFLPAVREAILAALQNDRTAPD